MIRSTLQLVVAACVLSAGCSRQPDPLAAKPNEQATETATTKDVAPGQPAVEPPKEAAAKTLTLEEVKQQLRQLERKEPLDVVSQPFSVESLPPSLRAVAAEALDSADYEDAFKAIEKHLAAGGSRDPHVLMALAYLKFLDACTIMVNDIVPCGEQALELIEEATAHGGAAEEYVGFRSKVLRRIYAIKEEEQRLLDLIDGGVPYEELERDDVQSLAHMLGNTEDREKKLLSVRLRFVSAAMSPQGVDGGAFWDYAHAGFALARISDWQRAMPILLDVTERPNPREAADYDHLVEFGFNYRLEHAGKQKDADGFSRLWWQAEAVLAQLAGPDSHFPTNRLSQDEFLQMAFDMELGRICRRLLIIYDQHREAESIDASTQELIAKVRAKDAVAIATDDRGDEPEAAATFLQQIPDHYALDITWSIKAAEMGGPDAKTGLGTRYLAGDGVPQDDKQAAIWLSPAAEAGYAPAQYYLGKCYDRGGNLADESLSAKWTEAAAQQGYPTATQ